MLNIKINKYKQCNSFRSIYNDGLKTTVRNPRLITLQYLLLVRSIGVIRRGLLMFQYSPLEMSEEYQRVIRRGLLTMNEDLFRYTSISLSQPLTCLLISCFIE